MFFAIDWLQIRKNIIKAGLQLKRLQKSRLKFIFQFQVPTTFSELTLSAYTSLICYKSSDDRVGRLRRVVTIRQGKALSLIVHWMQTLRYIMCTRGSMPSLC